MGRWAIGYAATAAAFLVLDLAWLGIAGPRLYRPALAALMRPRPRAIPAVAFYLIYVGAILALAVAPGLRQDSATLAAIYGAALGLAAYATYDLTNLATITAWPAKIALLDMAWGISATAVAASVGALTMIATGG